MFKNKLINEKQIIMKWTSATNGLGRNGNKPNYESLQPWLTTVSVPAKYEVHYGVGCSGGTCYYTWESLFWNGSQGHTLGEHNTADEAKEMCKQHLIKLMRDFKKHQKNINK